MFSPKGLRMASLYFRTVSMVGLPARVIVKLDDRGDHHFPAGRAVIAGYKAYNVVTWHNYIKKEVLCAK